MIIDLFIAKIVVMYANEQAISIRVLLGARDKSPTQAAQGKGGNFWLVKPREELIHLTAGLSGVMFTELNAFSLHLSFLLSSLCWLYSCSLQTSIVCLVGNMAMNKSPVSHLQIILLKEATSFVYVQYVKSQGQNLIGQAQVNHYPWNQSSVLREDK